MVTVDFSDLEDALEFSSFSGTYELLAYIDMETGAIISVSEDMQDDVEVPPDIDTSDRYLPVPDKKDLDLGNRLVFRFVEGHLPDDYDTVVGYFHKRGAYGRFKDLLDRRGALEAWYAFQKEKTEEALKKWCAQNDIQLSFAGPAAS